MPLSNFSYCRGHLITYDQVRGAYAYVDDSTLVLDNRPCFKCGKLPTAEGYDACKGYVPGATSVCCGHGEHEPILIMEV